MDLDKLLDDILINKSRNLTKEEKNLAIKEIMRMNNYMPNPSKSLSNKILNQLSDIDILITLKTAYFCFAFKKLYGHEPYHDYAIFYF